MEQKMDARQCARKDKPSSEAIYWGALTVFAGLYVVWNTRIAFGNDSWRPAGTGLYAFEVGRFCGYDLHNTTIAHELLRRSEISTRRESSELNSGEIPGQAGETIANLNIEDNAV